MQGTAEALACLLPTSSESGKCRSLSFSSRGRRSRRPVSAELKASDEPRGPEPLQGPELRRGRGGQPMFVPERGLGRSWDFEHW